MTRVNPLIKRVVQVIRKNPLKNRVVQVIRKIPLKNRVVQMIRKNRKEKIVTNMRVSKMRHLSRFSRRSKQAFWKE